MDIDAATEVLESNGYVVRAIESESYISVELSEFISAASQQKSITEIESLIEFIDFAEPDYLVYPCVFPNDPAFMNWQLWGLGSS